MTRVELSKLARLELHRLIDTRDVPEGETFARVEAALEQLRLHPESGQIVAGRLYARPRKIGVAWGWLCLLYVYDDERDLVTVTMIYDARTLGAPRA